MMETMDSKFSTRQAAHLVKMPEAHVRRYARAGLVGHRGPATWAFDFRDVAVLRAARRLVTNGLAVAKVERALLGLRRNLAAERSLSSVAVETVGGEVMVKDSGATWLAETGQQQLPFLGHRELTTPVEIPDQAPPAGADEWFELAVNFEEEAPQRAYEAYLRALATAPDHVEAMINIGRLCADAGELERATAYFRQAIRVDPALPVAHFNLGVALHDLGDLRGAVEAYRSALVYDAEFADAHYNLATLLADLGDAAGAKAHMRAYRSSCPV